jgi:hypothetical protein
MTNIVDILCNYPNQINALAAVSALVVSLLSIILTVWTLRQQRRHNFLSLTPIASILFDDYEDKIAVTVKNTGIGPLIVDTFRATDGKEEKDDLISWMPVLPGDMCWSTFNGNMDGFCIVAGEEKVVLRLQGNANDKTFQDARNNIRRALSTLSVTVTYKDIYNRKMKPKTRTLSWFGRRIK